ncbi:hypothetical protein Tco_0740959 [Tanacetum coccineum]
MNLYHSRLIQDNLNELIIKYKIPRDLHPRLPSEDFVMSELPDDAIGVYHRIFDFSGVRIPFSSFLLVIIKHYKVHFTQQGPLGLNKTLFKQGDWFSFAKRRAPSLVCIDDNRSYMKHWKSGFFLIDQRAIHEYMTWRHPDLGIDDPKPIDGSYRMADVRCLSAHVVKLRDMPEGALVFFGLSRVWKSQTCDPVLRGADGNVMGIHDFLYLPEWIGAEVQEEPHHDIRPTLQRLPFYCILNVVVVADVSDPTPEELAVSNPSAKVEAFQKRKASTSGSVSGHVAKRTRSAVTQSSDSTTRPNLFADDSGAESDDDDACYEILIVTPIRSAAVIPPSGNQSRGYAAPAAKGLNTQVAPFVGVSRLRVSSCPAPSFRELSRDAIHKDFFPFSPGPYYATYPEGGIAENCEFTREEWDAPHQPTLKRQITGLNDKLSASDAKSKAKGKERKKKIKSLTKSFDSLHAEVACLFADLNWATVLEAKKDEEILRLKATPPAFVELISLAASAGFERGLSMHRTKEEFTAVLKKISQFVNGMQDRLLKPEKLARPATVPASRDAYVSPSIVNESTVTLASTLLELLSNTVPTSFAVALEPNEEWGVSHVVDDVTELTMTGSERVSSGTGDVVVALSAREKGDGSVPSSTGKGAWFDGPNIAFFYVDIELSRLALDLSWLPPFLSIGVHWYMFPLRHCCLSELFARKEEIAVTPLPALCQSFRVLTLLIMEYLVKISKKERILELKQRHLKKLTLTSYTPYPSRKIRRIYACTLQKTTKDSRSIRRIHKESIRRI